MNSVVSELSTFRSEFSSNTTFKEGTEEYDITIRTSSEEESGDKNSEDLSKLRIVGNSNTKYELKEIADIIYANGMSSINRVNQDKLR